MKCFVFTEDTLAQALAARESQRQAEGASEQQAKDETQIVLEFFRWALAEQPKMAMNVPA